MKKLSLEDVKEHFSYCIDEGLAIGEQEEILLDSLYKKAEKVQKLQQIREIVANAHQEALERKDKEIELLKKEVKSDKECIAKMAKRIKAFEEKYLYP